MTSQMTAGQPTYPVPVHDSRIDLTYELLSLKARSSTVYRHTHVVAYLLIESETLFSSYSLTCSIFRRMMWFDDYSRQHLSGRSHERQVGKHWRRN
jgi:hypothetical protein